MNLEHCRKDAKRLLRGVAAGDADALARAADILGDRVDERFGLSDAQHVVAGERGYRSWPALVHAAAGQRAPAPPPEPEESVVNTGMEYRPGTRSASGSGVARGGSRSLTAARRFGAPAPARAGDTRAPASTPSSTSTSRAPASCGSRWWRWARASPQVVRRIGRASLVFFQELLELESPVSRGARTAGPRPFVHYSCKSLRPDVSKTEGP